ncbi:hypothetical protein GCM10007392_11630 [Saccharospirillum salsuginis]|uniref:HTH cro/C1-type domain-containing protein n=2 Tax=Saccharospirillum salsuginis TaxID=418750 RepID=A0A918N6I2_9GAMM|nr:hypothetical protein GCM10007392_11630 [Saccharospirillum salsuginis]
MSQKQLGIEAGFDPSSASPRMNQYEKGKHHPDATTVAKLCEVLGVPVAYLYCDDDDLARVIANFSKVGEKDRKRILAIVDTVKQS